jgi:pyruvate,water dikinase
MNETAAAGTYQGLGAAPGSATGPARLVRQATDTLEVPAGAVLVVHILHPHLAPLLSRVAGLVVEEGSLLQHATTLAREFGVPAVVGLTDALTVFRDGDVLEVNGATGAVRRREG